ncbi:tetraacyldisaccharide 4'-kinase [Odoribacter sp. OttesenSCG-928-J03]|nr:tetraacyldisaccharide 4'-kinase [Odoribacter sp. OttesenSCG-928-J03]MDL2283349.1 tetraacyldisaccharide 4'-kinase [Odoribacter sp. OttesenSCG-928-G04]MDL2331331.1 tetraacyldisaccharide 4'-kinase [Odoribacter sp. OttesenSCG-928-A06]
MLLKILLLPLSALYGLVVGIRNFMFNYGMLKSREFSIPVICVGNITVGGTGKTPHTELIISELQKKYKVACLSRGYKRKTTGFILADEHSTASDIGDEPLQIKLKFPNIIVASDANRVRGIETILNLPEKPDVIILDDAFQHRYVKAGKNVLLMDYTRLVYKDFLLPAGRLRESKKGLRRADYIIVSKCPSELKPIEKRIIFKHLKIKPYQKLFFTTTAYGNIQKLFPGTTLEQIPKDASVLCVTGIAKPEPYIAYLKENSKEVHELRFPDHHHFSLKDIQQIASVFKNMKNPHKYIFTTEKDAVRLKSFEHIPDEIKDRIYYIPIAPTFLAKQDLFITELNDYVAKTKK